MSISNPLLIGVVVSMVIVTESSSNLSKPTNLTYIVIIRQCLFPLRSSKLEMVSRSTIPSSPRTLLSSSSACSTTIV
ncbi:uncharacterized protein BJ171DRAFT_542899 [Polychytrium aggregatum]|uniref:uncharacterized protein n=1 Tax=Polychytrium aggregatum TaxID=110093 RepID=UPI0022FED8D8|nr:uncharacterized protein BJ171DRAFT_542899 [Polychytrium aggregatum]KAI9190660.1 hypothetical protein BJ171DRAFT_542899 [Polychytrium aggregatum]